MVEVVGWLNWLEMIGWVGLLVRVLTWCFGWKVFRWGCC